MTLDELNRHFSRITELNKAKGMLQSLRDAAYYPKGQVLTGMPHAPGVKDKVGDLGIEIADLEAEIADIEARVEQSAEPVRIFIAGIPDIQIRMIFRLRFSRGLAWKEVAQVLGGGNSEAGVKSAAYRYLDCCNGVLHDDAC